MPDPPVPSKQNLLRNRNLPLYSTLALKQQTGIKKADVKRLHKIVQDIAAPMSPEHTLTYVQREVEIAKIKVDADALEKGGYAFNVA